MKITLVDLQEAYLFFERTNARGRNLEVGDLLKAHLFANHPNETEIIEIWDAIVDRSNNQLTRMLKYFYIIEKGHITSSKLFKGLKELYEEEEDKNHRVKKIVERLDEFSIFFDAVHRLTDEKKLIPIFDNLNGGKKRSIDALLLNSIYHSIDGLNLFRITQVTPLLWSFLMKFYGLKLNDERRHRKTILYFFKSLENYHFINNFISDRVGNEVEKLYASYARDFSSVKDANDFSTLLKELYSDLKNKLQPKETFISEFCALEYADSASNVGLYYIFDRFNNSDVNKDGEILSPSDRDKIYHAYIPVAKTDIEIEHWYPRSRARDKNKKVLSWCNNIGNLIAITRKVNQNKLRDKPPQEKYEILKDNPQYCTFHHNKRFINEYAPFTDWDESAINDRAAKLAEEAYTSIWKFDPPG
jgi:hypothetical protein